MFEGVDRDSSESKDQRRSSIGDVFGLKAAFLLPKFPAVKDDIILWGVKD